MSDVIDKLKDEGWIEPWQNKENECQYWTHEKFPYIELDCETNLGEVRIHVPQTGKLSEIAQSDVREIVLTRVDVFLANSIIELVLEDSV